MQNKKLTMIAMAILAIAVFVFAYVFVFQKQKENRKALENQKVLQNDAKEVDLPKIDCSQMDDQAAYKKSIEEKEIGFCGCIKDNRVKGECLESQDINILSQAMDNFDIDLCEKIKDNDKRGLCERNIKSGLASLRINELEESVAKTYVLFPNSNNIDKYEKLIKADFDNAEYLMQLSLAYCDKGIRNREFEKNLNDREYFNKSISVLDRAEGKMENNTQFYRVKGQIYLSNFEFDEARKYLDKAVLLSPEESYLYITLAQILYQQKENDLAIQKSQKGLSLMENDSVIPEHKKNDMKIEFYSIMVGAYHQLGDFDNEEKYKKMTADLMAIIKK